MAQKPKSIVTFSGGMDSATLICYLLKEGHDVATLSVDYGQRHKIELQYATKFCKRIGVAHTIADLRGVTCLLGGSSLTDPTIPVPHGHYGDENMKLTVVPNRNMLLLSVATAYAVSLKAQYVAYAAHAGDHTIYPDCRPEFADAMSRAIDLCDWDTPKLVRPFMKNNKADIAKIGAELGVPYELTWSCYEGGSTHCGACGTCIERREAFLTANVKDPTAYSDTAPAMKIVDGSMKIDWLHTYKGAARPKQATDPVSVL